MKGEVNFLSTLPLKNYQHGETVVGAANLPHDKAETTEDVRNKRKSAKRVLGGEGGGDRELERLQG